MVIAQPERRQSAPISRRRVEASMGILIGKVSIAMFSIEWKFDHDTALLDLLNFFWIC